MNKTEERRSYGVGDIIEWYTDGSNDIFHIIDVKGKEYCIMFSYYYRHSDKWEIIAMYYPSTILDTNTRLLDIKDRV